MRRARLRPPERLRRRLLDRAGWRCERCGQPVSTGRRASNSAEIHHVDHARDHLDPERLAVLCRGCHIAHHQAPADPRVAEWKAFVNELLEKR